MKNFHALIFFIIITLAAIFLFAPKVTFSASGLIINEIMYDAPGADDKHEWVELYNASATEIDLTDYKFNDGSNHILNPPPQNGGRGSLLIPANGYLILSGNASTTILDLPNYNGSIIDTVMSLNNTSAVLKILGEDNAEIASASYTNEIGGNGNGKTLKWDGGSFKESLLDGGTPGKENDFSSPPNPPNLPNQPPTSTAPAESAPQNVNQPQSPFNNFSDKIFISEFMPWPQDGNEWVELINTGAETINLSGWQIDDEPENSASQAVPAGTLIEPSKYLIIELNRNILNNEGDQLRLLWPDNQIVHAISFKSAKQGFSSSRFENGSWLWTNNPTPGQENKKPSAESTPITQASSPQTAAQTSRQTFNPLIETAPETAAQKSSQPAAETASPKDEAPESPDIPNAPDVPSLQAAISAPIPNQISTKNSNPKIILSIAAILILSISASLGLIYFRRKKPTQQKHSE